jgi:hypothetical protein
MEVNWLIVLAATAVPMVTGFIWYNPTIGFGKSWMAASGMTMEKAKSANMGLIMGLTALFAFLIAISMQSIVIHQYSIFGILSMQPDSADPASRSSVMLKDFMENYGTSYRTFKHGAFHGALFGIMFALPLIGTGALYEGKGFKYIAIHSGYWILNLALMGGIICAFN